MNRTVRGACPVLGSALKPACGGSGLAGPPGEIVTIGIASDGVRVATGGTVSTVVTGIVDGVPDGALDENTTTCPFDPE